jgi:hypothetical protein
MQAYGILGRDNFGVELAWLGLDELETWQSQSQPPEEIAMTWCVGRIVLRTDTFSR